MEQSADTAAEKPENRAMFDANMVDRTARFLGVNGQTPPTADRILRNYSEYQEAYEEARQPETQEEREKRMAAAKALLGDLKKSTQKSFVGKLKSFFVGNSKEYNDAFAAMEGLANGTLDPQQAKEAIRKYLDLRGNKVRDHQYGRDRFDAMMKGLALVSRPKEFENFCQDLTEARQYRSKGAYKGKVDPADYQPGAREAERGTATREQDIQRINADSLDGRFYRKSDDFFAKLRNAKQSTPELEQFALEHPGVREAAREIATKNGLEINIPKSPTGLSDDLKGKLREQESNVRLYAGLPPKQAEQTREQRAPEGPTRQGP